MDTDKLFDVFDTNYVLPTKKIKLQDQDQKIDEVVDINILDDIDTNVINPGFQDVSVELDNMPHIMIHTVDTKECLHEVAIPPGLSYVPLIDMEREFYSNLPPENSGEKYKPAKEYPFTLDPFQREAVQVLENYQSVLVSAHTSAGKTAIAEYAIAMSLRDKQRVIYTTPIKALSNQKYRELYDQFGADEVGLMTGDITINPSGSCLVMTTEILRSMLYKGSEVMREVGWVIFDEIHYMRDKERGVVWEETIILLPDQVHYVFLSATIPNARQFAEWICYLHKQPCHVVYTDYRPTPLQHYAFPANGDCLYLVVDENGEFNESNFSQAMTALRDSGGERDERTGRRGGSVRGQNDIFKLVKMIMERDFQPVIVFSFSRKECEMNALHVAKLDFNSKEEKKLVEEVFNNAIDILSEEDKKLPQIHQLLPILKKGIGIHHSGLLPIIKETIEILFSEGLIKALFATETFAMGLNMPARTVLFTSCRKFDGTNNRWISSGEYIQMSGRAGRRGIDDKGLVILIIDQRMGSNVGKNIIKGQPDPLNSAFHLTYNMVLNLLRVEGINPEYMLEKSFHQFQNYSAIPALKERIQKLDNDYAKLNINNESEVAKYYRLRSKLDELQTALTNIINKPEYILPFLQPGRLVMIKHNDMVFDWGMVLKFYRRPKKNSSINNSTTTPFGKNGKNSKTIPVLDDNNENDGDTQDLPLSSDRNDMSHDDIKHFKQVNKALSKTTTDIFEGSKYEYIVDILMHVARIKGCTSTTTLETDGKTIKSGETTIGHRNNIVKQIRPAVSLDLVQPTNNENNDTNDIKNDIHNDKSDPMNDKKSNNKNNKNKLKYEPLKLSTHQRDEDFNDVLAIPVLLPLIHKVSSVRLYYPDDLTNESTRWAVWRNIQQVKRQFAQQSLTINPNNTTNVTNEMNKKKVSFPLSKTKDTSNPSCERQNLIPNRVSSLTTCDYLPLINPIRDMCIKDPALKEIVKKIETFEAKIFKHPMFNNPEAEGLYTDFAEKMKLVEERTSAYKELQKTLSLIKMEELKHRKSVLRRLGFCGPDDLIELKGRVACEISTGDELVLTELMFNGAFNNLTTDQIVALLSCFVFQEKSSQMPKLSVELAGPLKMIQETARRVAKVSRECRLEIDELDYVSSFKPDIMDVVYAWSRGSSFHEIIKMADIFEGSIIRCMRRLEELLREMYHSAKAIGNVDLENKFSEGCTKIKRDIIFAASLYL